MSFLDVLKTIEKVGNTATTIQSFAKADTWGKIKIGSNVATRTIKTHQNEIIDFAKKHRGK